MNLKSSFFVILLGFLLPHIFTRLRLLYKLETTNHPSTLSIPSGLITKQGNYTVKYVNQLRNCEDLVLDERVGYAILSCDEGRDGWNTVMGVFSQNPRPASGKLYIYDYTRLPIPTLEPLRLLNIPANYHFHPLGISLHAPSSTLLVINHGLQTSTLDTFSLSRHGNSATFISSLATPDLKSPNAVAFLSASSVLVTNDHFFTPRNWFWLNTLETYLALPLGDITHIDLATQKTTKVARVAFANGIAVMDAGNTVAVASSSGARVLFYDITAQEDASAPPILTPKKEKIQAAVSTPFFPDNLHVTANNSLLVAGHAHLSSLTTFVKQREVCEEDTTSTGCDAVAPSYVMQWSEQKGLESIYLGTEIYTSSGVCMDVGRGVLMVSGLYGKGLLVWDE